MWEVWGHMLGLAKDALKLLVTWLVAGRWV